MAGNHDHRKRILAVEGMLLDNPKGLSMKQILNKLDYYYDISVRRQAIYSDICTLTEFYDVQQIRIGHTTIYTIKQL